MRETIDRFVEDGRARLPPPASPGDFLLADQVRAMKRSGRQVAYKSRARDEDFLRPAQSADRPLGEDPENRLGRGGWPRPSE